MLGKSRKYKNSYDFSEISENNRKNSRGVFTENNNVFW